MKHIKIDSRLQSSQGEEKAKDEESAGKRINLSQSAGRRSIRGSEYRRRALLWRVVGGCFPRDGRCKLFLAAARQAPLRLLYPCCEND